ncbi:MAG: hypothetical protein EA397_16845 [Deltaproteobacteria bacterium]|nr:MAG: hypothetical protein EA397_16845 [Deltaproteobacteria bacterium]
MVGPPPPPSRPGSATTLLERPPLTTTLDDVFVIPRAEDLSALGFVIKLDQAASSPEAIQRLVHDYVVTPTVARSLPKLFDKINQTVVRGEEYGHILHGGFGSGKSHLMTLLALLLDDHEAAWGKDHPVFHELASRHRSWVSAQRPLVVRAHMLSLRERDSGLDHVLYRAFSDACVARGKEPFVAADYGAILDEIRREAKEFPTFWERADANGIAPSAELFEVIAASGEEAQDQLVRAYLGWKGRSLDGAGVALPWGDGLHRMARHAKEQGFGAVVFLVDEFLLWLTEKNREEFAREINDMNTVVDHSTGARAVPMIVVFAQQQNIASFFPAMSAHDDIHRHLDHHAKRFERTALEDVELRHIVRGRVLRDRKDEDQIDEAIQGFAQAYGKAVDDLLGEHDRDYLAEVYPFHPALIETLVDVSNLMQRERSALRLLYELLAHNAHLPLGEVLPVGRVFEHVFPRAGVEAAYNVEELQRIHDAWYNRLKPEIDRFARHREASNNPLSDERKAALEQVLKTVLLGHVSPRLAGPSGERLTVQRLVALNLADTDGERLRSMINRVGTDLRDLTVPIKELQVVGEGRTAVVSYALGRASLTDVLRHAEDKVRSHHQLLSVFYKVIVEQFPAKMKGILEKPEQGTLFEVKWRETKRVGRVLFANVREQPNATFKLAPGESFRVVIDYPWDEPGHSVDEDRQRVASVRKRDGTQVTAAWLPRHFATQEMEVLRQLAAVQYVVQGGVEGELLQPYGTQERQVLLDQCHTRARTLEQDLIRNIKQAYGEHAQVQALIGHRDPDLHKGDLWVDLERIARELLDRRYPQHPTFGSAPTKDRLKELAAWMTQASNAGASMHYDQSNVSTLQMIGEPLELIRVGQSRATLEHTGRFARRLQELTQTDRVAWSPIADELTETFGLPAEVRDLLLIYVCLSGFRLRENRSGERVEPRIGMNSTAFTLERANVLPLPRWSAARKLAEHALGLDTHEAHRSLTAQDDLFRAAHEQAVVVRGRLQDLHRELQNLEAGDGRRAAQIRQGLDGLAPLVDDSQDSAQALEKWLDGWNDPDAHLAGLCQRASSILGWLNDLDRRSLNHLRRASNPAFQDQIQEVLDDLADLLDAPEHERPLSKNAIADWNQQAEDLLQQIVQGGRSDGDDRGHGGDGTTTGGTEPPPPPPPGTRRRKWEQNHPQLTDLQAMIDEIRDALSSGRVERVELVAHIREEET